MVKFFSLILISFLFLLPFSKGEEPVWNEDRVDSLIEQIQEDTIAEDESSPVIPDGLFPDDFFDNMKKKIGKLANDLKLKFEDLKFEITLIIENLRSIGDNAVVTTDIDFENRTGSSRYYMKVDKPLADELGIDENYELYEVQFSWNEDTTD